MKELWTQIAENYGYLGVFLISMLPIVELRGAIPIGIGIGLNPYLTFGVAVVGNMLPVPLLILFSKKVLTWLSTFKRIGPFFSRFLERANEKAVKFGKYELFGLFCFVAVPWPGTGAWTGSLISAILQLRLLQALLVIFAGVVVAGIIVTLISMGVFGALIPALA